MERQKLSGNKKLIKMEIETKVFKAFNHKLEKIDLSHHENVIEVRPTEIHLKENGSKTDESSFLIVSEHPSLPVMAAQISLEMLNEGLEQIGYKIIKL